MQFLTLNTALHSPPNTVFLAVKAGQPAAVQVLLAYRQGGADPLQVQQKVHLVVGRAARCSLVQVQAALVLVLVLRE